MSAGWAQSVGVQLLKVLFNGDIMCCVKSSTCNEVGKEGDRKRLHKIVTDNLM